MDQIHPTFSHHDFEVLKREILYQGIFRLSRYHLRHRSFKGNWSNTITREVLERKLATAILPYDPVLDHVVLIEQFRPGALASDKGPWLLEIVAGIYNENENPDEVAKREAMEEAGCPILDICPIYEFFVSPGGSNEYVHLFCGRIEAKQIEGIYGLPEENEDIRAFTLPSEEAYGLVKRGKIKTTPAIIALQWLMLNREWLKQQWQIK